MARVLVATSGGVDSSVAAALLVDAGHDVTAVYCKLSDVPDEEQVPGAGCCTLDDAQDARRVAQVLDIPFYVWDLSARFRREVQGPFAAAYAAGRTPNPCVTCNERVKYAALLGRARRLGFDALATGHHARVVDGRLLRAVDRAKDQSYVLYVATPDQLAHTLLPIGAWTKAEVRASAAERGLRVADKPDSYDVCFIPDGDTAGYLADHVPPAPGPIVDLDGRTLGQHVGVWRYTVGQRRGLGLGTSERRFVVDVDADARRVVVGPREALACSWIRIGPATWTRGAPPDDDQPLELQLRAHGRTYPVAMTPDDDGWRLDLAEPAHGVAVGQAAVLYRGEECLGGGRITAAARPAVPQAG